MDMPLDARVRCTDGDGGYTTRIILNPLTREVTDVVVRTPGLRGVERLVPLAAVASSAPHEVALRLSREQLDSMQRFLTEEDVRVPRGSGDAALYGPYWALGNETVTVRRESIPPDELAVRRGFRVEAIDGRVGRVDELLIDPASSAISHLVLREGHLWGERDVTIPVDAIDRIDDRAVHLKLDKDAVGALSTVPVPRRAR